MTGITDLDRLLAEMQPELMEGSFVYCSVPFDSAELVARLQPIGTFREREGLTLILPADVASGQGLAGSPPMRMITLTVHSSLEAVGLTAAIAAALTRDGISANVVAAYHHDHVFVPADDADSALEALRTLSRDASRR